MAIRDYGFHKSKQPHFHVKHGSEWPFMATLNVWFLCDFLSRSYALANLSFHNTPNTAQIVSLGSIPLVVLGMLKHASNLELQGSATVLLCNLCYNSDPIRTLLGKAGGPRAVVNMLRTHPNNRHLFDVGCQALGNLGLCAENVPMIVRCKE